VSNDALANIDAAKKMLAEAKDLTSTLEIRDMAVAAQAYATAKGADEAAQMALEIKLRSERKAGVFIKTRPKAKTGPKLPDTLSGNSNPTLKQLGVSDQESSRWQRMADVPDDKFEELIEKGKIKTQAAILSVARAIRQEMEAEVKSDEIRTAPVTANIKLGHYLKVIEEIGPKSVDLLITDPPYMTDVKNIDHFVSWLNPVLKTLKDTGQAYIFTGAYYPELKAYMNQLDKDEATRFTKQVLVWEYRNTLGPSPKSKYKQNWQAIFYLRGPDADPINTENLVEKFTVQQFNAPDARHEQTYHTWEKPLDLAKMLIRHGSNPDDLIFDPFAGTGSFLLAAAELGRKNIGSDIDQTMIDIAVKRGCQLK